MFTFFKKKPKNENMDAMSKLFFHTSSREQKKIFMKAIDSSIKKQQEVIKRAEAM